jgi:hypothetical protein
MSEAAEKMENLTDLRPWKLHVVTFNKNCQLPEEGLRKIVKICRGRPWVLDIDEDYVSTQNPFAVSFKAHYGEEVYDALVDIFDTGSADDDKYGALLERILKKDIFAKSKQAFGKDTTVQEAVALLRGGGMSTRKAAELMDEYRNICRKVVPVRADADSDDVDPLHEREIFQPDDVVSSATMDVLPHHVSTLGQIVALLKNTRSLFEAIRTQPGVVTVATSRYDEYTPAPQAETINVLTLDMLKDKWEHGRVFRRDFRSKLSIEDRYEPGGLPDTLRLFLSRGQQTR